MLIILAAVGVAGIILVEMLISDLKTVTEAIMKTAVTAMAMAGN